MGLRRMVEGVNWSMIYCKNLCKCYKVPLPSTTILKKGIKMFMMDLNGEYSL
jgi:hypothetical protein